MLVHYSVVCIVELQPINTQVSALTAAALRQCPSLQAVQQLLWCVAESIPVCAERRITRCMAAGVEGTRILCCGRSGGLLCVLFVRYTLRWCCPAETNHVKVVCCLPHGSNRLVDTFAADAGA